MQTLFTASPAPFDVQWVRSHDQKNGVGVVSSVKNINPASGSFSWASFDALMSSAPGAKVLFTLGMPADWMIGRAAVGGTPYGGKANLCPTGSTELAAYVQAVQAIATRARDTFGVTGIAWELWNEFGSPVFYGDVITSLGPYSKAVAQAIKAIDPTAIILAPSYVGGMYGAQSGLGASMFLPLSDGAGGKAGDWVDGISLHAYGVGAVAYAATLRACETAATAAGYPGLPVYVTETGVLSFDASQEKELQRRLMVFASLGAKCVIGYACDFEQNPLASHASAWNATVAALSGKTITRCVKRADQSVRLTFADGGEYVA